jgi:exodeoxyribonuclease VII large subunit
MLQPSLFPANSISVSELTRYLREWMESDELLRDVWVEGEISNLSRPASGHIYFTLKDEYSALKCVIWRTAAGRASDSLQPGLAVEVHGYVSIYDREGAYQLYVDTVRPAGEGSLFQEFLRLRAQLEAEGLFDPARKREIPQVPSKIGIVTSPTGAALQDMLNTLRRRYPLVEVVIAPASVQGDNAPGEIVAALALLNREPGMDVILVARGGGSLEDLWAFNDERVVRAVAASKVPVISGVGHETDFTLTDFAADLRAPTPTAAAEQAVPDQTDVRERLLSTRRSLRDALSSRTQMEKLNLAEINRKLSQLSPLMRVRSDRQHLDEISARTFVNVQHNLQMQRSQTLSLGQRLKALNPYVVLQRGYAIITNEAGEIIQSVDQTFENDALTLRVSDGLIAARVSAEPQKNQAGE